MVIVFSKPPGSHCRQFSRPLTPLGFAGDDRFWPNPSFGELGWNDGFVPKLVAKQHDGGKPCRHRRCATNR
jgi:hypothetical protein